MVDRFEHCRWCGGRGCAACPEEHRKHAEAGGELPSLAPKPPAPKYGDCYECGAPAHLLCDGRIPHPSGEPVETCDRWLCSDHVAYQSRVKYQKWAKGRGRYCEWDTIDYCADCLAREKARVEDAQQREAAP